MVAGLRGQTCKYKLQELGQQSDYTRGALPCGGRQEPSESYPVQPQQGGPAPGRAVQPDETGRARVL